MNKNSDVVNRMERDALYAYLELMQMAGNIPDKQTYDGILKIKNAEALDELISLMESEIGNLEKLQKVKKVDKPSLIQRILNAIKNSYL